MDIAAASIQMGLAQVQLGAGYAIAEKIMDTTEAQAEQLLQMMAQAPSFGHRLDVRV